MPTPTITTTQVQLPPGQKLESPTYSPSTDAEFQAALALSGGRLKISEMVDLSKSVDHAANRLGQLQASMKSVVECTAHLQKTLDQHIYAIARILFKLESTTTASATSEPSVQELMQASFQVHDPAPMADALHLHYLALVRLSVGLSRGIELASNPFSRLWSASRRVKLEALGIAASQTLCGIISTLSLTLAEQSESEGLERAAVLEARIATRLTALDRVTVPIPVAPTIATTVAPPPTIIVQKEAQTTSAAESPEILTSRAERYLRGQGGLRQCATTAAQLVRRAVRQARSDGATYAPAWFLLGTLYLAGDGLAKDIVAGAQCVFRAAGVSDGSGGTTIQVDPAMGANGMSAAPSQVPLPGPAPGASGVTAEKVYPSPSLDALTLLAEWYTTGYLVRQSAAHAVQLYLTAARAGHAPAMLGLAQLASERPLAAEWYEAAAKRGSGRAARELGHFAASPSVTPVNDEDPPSQGVLAEDVAHSQDLPDWDRAAHWYTLAATLGDTDGMCALGACYEAGLGVSQCWVTAAHWYAASARRGSTSALANLGYIYWRQSKYVSAWNAWTLASQRSPPSPDALIHMACVYRDGCEWQPTAADVRALLVAHSSRQEPQDVFKGNGSAEPVWVIPDGSDDLLLPFVITQSYELAVSHCLKAAKLGHEPARALLDELIQLSSQASPL